MKCPEKECEVQCKTFDAIPIRNGFQLDLFFNCYLHGEFSKIRTIKGLLK